MKTSGIKLSEIRPCDGCGGKIAPIFNVVTVKMAAFNLRNVNSVLGTSQILGHRSLAIAEALAAGADNAIEVLEDENATTRLFLCQNCCSSEQNLAALAEKRYDATERRDREAERA